MKTDFPQLSVLCNFPYFVAWLQRPPSEASPPHPLKIYLFLFMRVCMSVCLYAHVSVNPRKGQKRVSEPLKLEATGGF